MHELIVAVFDTEDAALKGMRTLTDHHDEGGISLYASALIVKGKDGNFIVKQQNERAPLGSAVGLLVGGIIGILGGAAAGYAVGTALGGQIGLLVDWVRTGIDLRFLDEVGKTLTAGKAAVLAEIEESWTSVLEDRWREQGGVVFRRFRIDVVEDQLLQESKAVQRQLEVLKEDLDKANAANRQALQNRIRDVKKQLETIENQARAAIDLKKAETELKVKVLREQAETAVKHARARIEKRITDTKTDFEMRRKKLDQALVLAKEAIAPLETHP